MIQDVLLRSSDKEKFINAPILHPWEERKLLDGVNKTLKDRFFVDERLVFTLVRVEDGKEFPCVTLRTLGLYFNVKHSEVERARISALKRLKVFNIGLSGFTFRLKGADPHKIKNNQLSDSEKYAKKARKVFYHKNKEIERKRKDEWAAQNKDRIREYNNKYALARRAVDPSFKMRMNLRNRIRLAIKDNTKSGGLIKLIGCSIDELKSYLEKKITDGMTWENYGKFWVIDHIKPCCSFDLSLPEEQAKCFNYENLQPLTAIENSIKGGRLL